MRYGKQYNYRCPSCHREVIPPFTPSLDALDLSNLGTRIGDRDKPLAAATMARAERCRQRFAEFPAVLMPAKAQRGSERHPWQPMATQTSQQETAILSTGALMAAAGNTFESAGLDAAAARDLVSAAAGADLDDTGPALSRRRSRWRSTTSRAPRAASTSRCRPRAGRRPWALLSAGVLPYRRHTTPTSHAEAMPTVTADQIPGLLTAAGTIKNNGSILEAKYRAHPVSDPLGTVDR